MLRRMRALLCALSWNLAIAGWVTALVFALLGARFACADRITMSLSGGATLIGGSGKISRRVRIHAAQHKRIERQVGAATSILRKGFHEDGYGDRIPAALLDDRALRPDGAEVVELTRRATPAHRQHRSQRRKP